MKTPHIGKAKIHPLLNHYLLKYQLDWANDSSRLKLCVKGRQLGWTWTNNRSHVCRKSVKGARGDVWISSRDEASARHSIEACYKFTRLYDIGARLRGQTLVDRSKSSSYTLRLTSGCQIHCLSSNPDAQAGKAGDRVLDEFALHPDPHRLYSIAYPGITWGGRLEIFSTPRGTNNYFQTLIDEILHGGNPKGFSFHKVTLQDALDQGFLYKLQGRLPADDVRQGMDETDYYNFIRKGCPDEETFMQEYMCVPGDDCSAFLTYDLIASCEYAADMEWEGLRHSDPNAQLYIGVDVGRMHDLTVIWVMEKFGDVLYTRAVKTMQRESFEAQEQVLYELLRLPQMKRCCIDQTGIGRQFAERAQQRFGPYRVEGVNFTSAVKEELAYPVRYAFETKRLRIPNDPKIRADLRAIKKENTASGNVRFVADRSANGHADRFWALALAVHAGARPPSRGPSAHVA